MTHLWRFTILAALGFTLVMWLYPDEQRRRGPDDKLVKYVDGMCEVMGKHVDTPRAGVDALFGYYGRNAPDMFMQFGALLVEIERIPDDRAHDRRARKANAKLRKAFKRCEPTAERFAQAVERDPRARTKLERGVERLGRTLEILLGGAGGKSPLGGLSTEVRRLLPVR
jgi:hypothetical protein